MSWIVSRLDKMGIKNRKFGEILELAYWKKASIPDWKLSLDTPLQPRIEDLLSRLPRRQFYVLDVCSGPVTTVGKKSVFDVTLIATDPLADKYNRMLAKRNIVPPVRSMDIPLSVFDDEVFDVVFARNSIDHAENPYETIQSMKRVCRGYVLMEHFLNTGYKEGYRGLHQWNFADIGGDTLLIWNRREDYKLRGVHNEIISEGGHTWLITTIDCTHKTHPTA